jgi:hypothetical protein
MAELAEIIERQRNVMPDDLAGVLSDRALDPSFISFSAVSFPLKDLRC